jgi:hypothetical protein
MTSNGLDYSIDLTTIAKNGNHFYMELRENMVVIYFLEKPFFELKKNGLPK